MTRTTAAALGLAAPAAPAGAVVLTADQLDSVTAGGTRIASSSGSRESTLVDSDGSDTGSVEFGGYQTDQVTISGTRTASSPSSREST